ncbi:MAG: tRNA (adenosine(37)-N6)-threonylcarbamoyltransferase complex ATPase subunit type 1 TsaE [Desulfobacca sp. 4484_104]|nr:MAG: tRNA (adenosine(37)-N6)-threonylcarbamoyltransferase complex ATPase subunit type 1 TsaE [Desulfobacca sp. 4484_104]RLA90680.1 MAG: tRNA (adenosine(37)-N6)-threonylcarbamoyltransferase complex ATPase subunit type 1 TsaE [Deltaproteobacteria bacterium]
MERSGSRVQHLRLASPSPEQTQAIAERLAARLQPGDVIALIGELGAGKTEFVHGLARGLQVPPGQVASPTFVLVHEYSGRLTLAHVDLYRLEQLSPDFLLELEEYWSGPYVTVIEWAERLSGSGPEEYLEITFTWTGEQSRELVLVGHGRRGEELIVHYNAPDN